jgi:hypothetical protein
VRAQLIIKEHIKEENQHERIVKRPYAWTMDQLWSLTGSSMNSQLLIVYSCAATLKKSVRTSSSFLFLFTG